MAPPATPPSARAKEFAFSMIRQHGCRYPDRIVIPLSQREIARRMGISPGTLGWYLNELGDTVLARRPLLTLHPNLDSQEESPSPVESSQRPEDTVIADLLRQLVDAVEASNELLRLTLLELRPPNEPESRSDRATGSRAGGVASRDSLARSDQKEEKDLLSSGLQPRDSPRDRTRDWVARSDVEGPEFNSDELLRPLEVAVRRCNLVPINDRSRLRRALAAYQPDEIAGAVARITGDIHRGVAIRSPFGLLIHKAELGDPDYFKAPDHGGAPPPAEGAHEEAPEPDEFDRLAELALTEMDANPARWTCELAALETAIDAHISATAGIAAGQLLTCMPYRQAVRHELYRAQVAEENRPS